MGVWGGRRGPRLQQRGRDGAAGEGVSRPAAVDSLGVDPAVFAPLPPAERPALRSALGLDPGRPVVGYLGRLHPEKGVAVLLAAAVGLPEVQVVLLGDGPQRAALATQAVALGLTDRVHFFGALPRPALARYLACCDALAVPSLTTPTWKEQFGRIDRRRPFPCVACRWSAPTSAPSPSSSARLALSCPKAMRTPLRGALAGLLADPSRARGLAAAARARALAGYTWERVASQRLVLYEEVLARG